MLQLFSAAIELSVCYQVNTKNNNSQKNAMLVVLPESLNLEIKLCKKCCDYIFHS